MSNNLSVLLDNQGQGLNEIFRGSQFVNDVVLTASLFIDVPEGLPIQILYLTIILWLFFSDLHRESLIIIVKE